LPSQVPSAPPPLAALLHALHQLGYAVIAAHLNHQLRGAAAP